MINFSFEDLNRLSKELSVSCSYSSVLYNKFHKYLMHYIVIATTLCHATGHVISIITIERGFSESSKET